MIFALDLPDRDAEADFLRAQAMRRRVTVRNILAAAQLDVFRSYLRYVAEEGSPYGLIPLAVEEDIRDALRGNYGLMTKGAPLSDLRDEILAAARPLGLCPMCGKGAAQSIDHYLPKDRFPEFSILAVNLVPACDRCNRSKLNRIGSRATGRFLHTYYDELPARPLLGAQATVDSSVTVSFYVNPELPDEIRLNATFHFETLDLGREYSAASVLELREQYDQLMEYYALGGKDSVARRLRQMAGRLRRRIGFHYWKAALYEGLSDSTEFCDGGFRRIVDPLAFESANPF